MTHRPHFMLAPAAVALSLLLGGCASSGGAVGNRTLESVHQPVVRLDHFAFDADTRAGELLPSEAARLDGWLSALDLRYGDRIAIDGSQGDGGRAVRDGVAALAERRGLLLADNAPITPGALQPGFTRVVVTRATARVDGCPNWASPGALGTSNTTSPNYGCAVNANLAAMIADPVDLVRTPRTGQSDPLTASKAIRAYRNALPSGRGGSLGGSGGSGGSGGGSAGGGNQNGGGGQ